jgi:hypothetical protein
MAKKKDESSEITEWIETLRDFRDMTKKCVADGDMGMAKDLAQISSKLAFNANTVGNLKKQEKDGLELEELKKKIAHIMNVKNRDAVK